MKRICKWCGKVLPPVGDRRKNGRRNLKDWDERKHHIECYPKMRTVRKAIIQGGHCVKAFDEKYC
jgi:hypothetical protein